MTRVRWASSAEADLNGIDDYWWERDPAYAIEITDRIRAASRRLDQSPAIGPMIDSEGVRKLRVPRSPYMLFYRFAAHDGIEILRIRHAREDWRPE